MKMRTIVFSIIRKVAKLLLRHRIDKFYLIKILWYNIFRPCFLRLYPDVILAVLGDEEEFETELFKKEIKRGDVVLDIGANIGYYTLIAAQPVGENGKIFAFEPDPANFALLQQNVKAFGYQNIIVVQNAVTSKTGKLKLYLAKDSKADHRIYDSQGDREFIYVEVVKLDDYFKNFDGKIDIIKMDIQGAEMGAIEGMRLLLHKNKELKLFTEFWPSGLKQFGVEPEEYLRLLIELNFTLYDINEQEKRIEPVCIAKLLEIYTPEKGNYTNLFCVKRE